jgi:transcriptional regulator with XRE-family HTH domain
MEEVMASVSLPPAEIARKSFALPCVHRKRNDTQERASDLAGPCAMGQNELAKAMGVHESTVSRLEGGQGHHDLQRALAHMGLKVVPVGMQCFQPDYVDALKTLAELGIRQQAPKLDWGNEAVTPTQPSEGSCELPFLAPRALLQSSKG